MRIIDREGFRARLQEKGYSIRQLAAELGCSAATIARLRTLNGKPPTIGAPLASALEKTLEVAPGTFFGPNPPRSPRAVWAAPQNGTEGGEQA